MPSIGNFIDSIMDLAYAESKNSTINRFHNVTAIICGKGTNFNGG
jgi:hypothetical protein